MRGIYLPLLTVFLISLFYSQPFFGQEVYIEEFNEMDNWSGGSAGSYNPKFYIYDGLPSNDQFSSNEAVRESGNVITGYAWRLRNSGTPYFIYELFDEVSTFSVHMAHWNVEVPLTVYIEYSLNGGESYELLESIDESWWTDQSLNSKEYGNYTSGILNIQPNAGDKIFIRISTDGNERLLIDNFQIEFSNVSTGIEDPLVFYAEAISENQINLIFAPNNSSDDVVIAFNESGSFLDPTGIPPLVGQSFAGGTLFYLGSSSPQIHVDLDPEQTVYYKAWSFNGSEYSSGLSTNATTEAVLFFPNTWINEFHYDNVGGDEYEFVEIVVENSPEVSIENLTVSLYNGSGGTVYASESVSNFIEGNTVNGFTLYYWLFPGIQNGAPEGVTLDVGGVLIPGQFLSYEGSFTGSEGPADGLISTDIEIEELTGTPVGHSLQLSGNGVGYSHFYWQGPIEDTPGEINSGQQIGGFSNWTGLISSDWNESGNWSDGIPDVTSNVLVPAIDLNTAFFPVITGSTTVQDLIVQGNSLLEIAPSGFLTVNGQFTNDGTLRIESDETGTGSLIESSGPSGVVERYLSPLQWHYMSMPVTPLYSNVFEGLYLMEWNEPEESWNYIEDLGIILDSEMQGYGVWNTEPATVQMEGQLNSGTFIKDLTNSPGSINPENDPSGYNLVGNPYPSALDWDIDDGLGWTRTTTNTALSIYYWNGSQYASYVKGGPNPGPNGGTNIIPPHQGFYVMCTSEEGGSISVTNEARIHSDQKLYKEVKQENSYLRLGLFSSNYSDESIVYINSEADFGFDTRYDAYKLMGCESCPQIYTLSSDDMKLSINTIPFIDTMMSVPIGFDPGASSDVFELKLMEQYGFDTIPVFLEDRQEAQFFDLKSNPGYKFFNYSEEDKNRFLLWFNTSGAPDNITSSTFDPYQVRIYSHGQTVQIVSDHTISGVARISGLDGKVLRTFKLYNRSDYKIQMEEYTGVFLVSVVTESSIFRKKIMLME